MADAKVAQSLQLSSLIRELTVYIDEEAFLQEDQFKLFCDVAVPLLKKFNKQLLVNRDFLINFRKLIQQDNELNNNLTILKNNLDSRFHEAPGDSLYEIVNRFSKTGPTLLITQNHELASLVHQLESECVNPIYVKYVNQEANIQNYIDLKSKLPFLGNSAQEAAKVKYIVFDLNSLIIEQAQWFVEDLCFQNMVPFNVFVYKNDLDNFKNKVNRCRKIEVLYSKLEREFNVITSRADLTGKDDEATICKLRSENNVAVLSFDGTRAAKFFNMNNPDLSGNNVLPFYLKDNEVSSFYENPWKNDILSLKLKVLETLIEKDKTYNKFEQLAKEKAQEEASKIEKKETQQKTEIRTEPVIDAQVSNSSQKLKEDTTTTQLDINKIEDKQQSINVPLDSNAQSNINIDINEQNDKALEVEISDEHNVINPGLANMNTEVVNTPNIDDIAPENEGLIKADFNSNEFNADNMLIEKDDEDSDLIKVAAPSQTVVSLSNDATKNDNLSDKTSQDIEQTQKSSPIVTKQQETVSLLSKTDNKDTEKDDSQENSDSAIFDKFGSLKKKLENKINKLTQNRNEDNTKSDLSTSDSENSENLNEAEDLNEKQDQSLESSDNSQITLDENLNSSKTEELTETVKEPAKPARTVTLSGSHVSSGFQLSQKQLEEQEKRRKAEKERKEAIEKAAREALEAKNKPHVPQNVKLSTTSSAFTINEEQAKIYKENQRIKSITKENVKKAEATRRAAEEAKKNQDIAIIKAIEEFELSESEGDFVFDPSKDVTVSATTLFEDFEMTQERQEALRRYEVSTRQEVEVKRDLSKSSLYRPDNLSNKHSYSSNRGNVRKTSEVAGFDVGLLNDKSFFENRVKTNPERSLEDLNKVDQYISERQKLYAQQPQVFTAPKTTTRVSSSQTIDVVVKEKVKQVKTETEDLSAINKPFDYSGILVDIKESDLEVLIPSFSDEVYVNKESFILKQPIIMTPEISVYGYTEKESIQIFNNDYFTEFLSEKLKVMLNHKLVIDGVLWPTKPVYNLQDALVGVTRKYSKAKNLKKLLRKHGAGLAHLSQDDLIKISIQFLEKLKQLQSLNVYLGDEHLESLLLDDNNQILITNLEQLQIGDYKYVRTYDGYRSPELKANDNLSATKKSADFIALIIVFKILLTGTDPFLTNYHGEGKDFRFANDSDDEQWNALSDTVQEMFRRTFTEGIDNSSKRASIEDLISALQV